MKSDKRNNRKNGFTLIEALVAISILMIAIASPMTLAQKGLSTATLSKDQMIASFLAQDALEGIRNIRDQIAVTQTSGSWLGAVLQPCICSGDSCNFDSPTPTYCSIDTTTSSNTILSGQNQLLSFNDTSGNFSRYGYGGNNGTPSKFTRKINIKVSGSNPDEAVVSVRVSWDSSYGTQNIDVQDFLYNYSENL